MEQLLYHRREKTVKHKELADQVMKMLLSGSEEVLLTLREQYERAVIISEEDTEVGFFIRYEVDSAIRIGEEFKAAFQVGDIDGEMDEIDGAVGFILFIKDGYLTMLEGYTNGVDKWPEMDTEIQNRTNWCWAAGCRMIGEQ